jgi:hypothetical protein
MACPNCGRDDQLDVTMLIDARLTPDGDDIDEADNHDHEWDRDAWCKCGACGHLGHVYDFDAELKQVYWFKPNEHWNTVEESVYRSLEAAGYGSDRLRITQGETPQ